MFNALSGMEILRSNSRRWLPKWPVFSLLFCLPASATNIHAVAAWCAGPGIRPHNRYHFAQALPPASHTLIPANNHPARIDNDCRTHTHNPGMPDHNKQMKNQRRCWNIHGYISYIRCFSFFILRNSNCAIAAVPSDHKSSWEEKECDV